MDNKKTLDIFISTHKDFKVCPTNDIYKIVTPTNFKIEKGLKRYVADVPLYELSYNELMAIYWIWQNYPLKKYVGLCHYRKYFDFFNDVPNIDDIFKNHDIILLQPLHLGFSIYKQYSICHNGEDLEMVSDIIREKYKDLYDFWIDTLNQNILCYANMFIMRTDDFQRYCNFLFPILKEYEKRNGLTYEQSYREHVENNKEKYLKTFSPNNEVWYQMRICGYLSERLFTFWVMLNFKNPKFYNMKLTETKYNNKY